MSDTHEEVDKLKPLKLFLKGFLSSYGLKTTINLLFQFQSKKPLDLKKILLDEESIRIAAAFGVFSSIYHQTKLLLKDKTKHSEIIAGFVSGFSFFFIKKKNRRILSLYLLTRTLHSYIQKYPFFENYGNVILFALSSAQVLYSWVIEPKTLPKSYLTFITQMSPIDQSVLDQVYNYHHSKQMSSGTIEKFCSKHHKNITHDTFPWGCLYLHPHTKYCSMNVINVFTSTIKKIIPLYSFISFTPVLLSSNPNFTLGAKNTFRSVLFLAFFNSIYQTVACSFRKFISKDYSFIYYISGLICSFSILIEKKKL
eukprot:gene771-9021_t